MTPDQIADLLIQSETEAKDQIWLIASENLPSPLTRLALATSGVNRYLFKYQYAGKRFCPGTEIYQQLYDYCVEALKEAFHASYVSLRPLSGMNAMTMVITTYVGKDEPLFCIAAKHGGHTHTDKIAAALGRKLHNIPMRVQDDCFFVDYDQLAKDLATVQPRLLYLDPMSYPFQFDLERLKAMTPAGCAIHYDTSHVMAFVLSGSYGNALDLGYDSFGGSTHKTFPSIQKAFFATNRADHFDQFEKFSCQMLSSLHTSSIVALAVTMTETTAFFKQHGHAILANAAYCCECLENAGFKIVGPSKRKTDCHVVFWDVAPHCEPMEACHRLQRANIITHPITLPLANPRPGLRLGVQEITALGMGRAEIKILVDVFRKILIENQPPEKFAGTIAELRRQHPRPTFSFADSKKIDALLQALIQ